MLSHQMLPYRYLYHVGDPTASYHYLELSIHQVQLTVAVFYPVVTDNKPRRSVFEIIAEGLFSQRVSSQWPHMV